MIVCEWTAEKWGDKQSFAVDVCGQLLLTYKNENIYRMARETVETDRTQEVKRVEKLVGVCARRRREKPTKSRKNGNFRLLLRKRHKTQSGVTYFLSK